MTISLWACFYTRFEVHLYCRLFKDFVFGQADHCDVIYMNFFSLNPHEVSTRKRQSCYWGIYQYSLSQCSFSCDGRPWGSLILILINLFVLHQYLIRQYVATARDSLLHDFLTINFDQRIKGIPYAVHMIVCSFQGPWNLGFRLFIIFLVDDCLSKVVWVACHFCNPSIHPYWKKIWKKKNYPFHSDTYWIIFMGEIYM